MPFKSAKDRKKSDAKDTLGLPPRPKKTCFFCDNKKEPTYTDTVVLKKFLNDRIRIVSKQRSGACSKHQRRISVEIKHARHLALLPFVPTI